MPRASIAKPRLMAQRGGLRYDVDMGSSFDVVVERDQDGLYVAEVEGTAEEQALEFVGVQRVTVPQ